MPEDPATILTEAGIECKEVNDAASFSVYLSNDFQMLNNHAVQALQRALIAVCKMAAEQSTRAEKAIVLFDEMTEIARKADACLAKRKERNKQRCDCCLYGGDQTKDGEQIACRDIWSWQHVDGWCPTFYPGPNFPRPNRAQKEAGDE